MIKPSHLFIRAFPLLLIGGLLLPSSAMAQERISVGRDVACEVLDGSVYCWGSNRHGQIAPGEGGGARPRTRIAGLPSMRSVSAAYRHTCALSTDAGPARVPGLPPATVLTAGGNTS